MDSESQARPELDEFLNALDGFVSKSPNFANPADIRFLGTFCRSIGSTKGHLLRINEKKKIHSHLTFGISNEFNEEFNRAVNKPSNNISPMEMALRQKEVIAIVDLDKDPDLPEWFDDLMKKNKFCSLVAVPLLGKEDATSVLCAYYHDVCLFDQGTLDHLFMIGKMAGAAMERESAPAKGNGAAGSSSAPDALDMWIDSLTHEGAPSKMEVYTDACRITKKMLDCDSVICGPVRKTENGLLLTIAAGKGIPSSEVSNRFVLPKKLESFLLSGKSKKGPDQFTDWGAIAPLLEEKTKPGVVSPIFWKNKLMGMLAAWPKNKKITKKNLTDGRRIASSVALMLNLKDN